MEYSKWYGELSSVFDPYIEKNKIPESDITIINAEFISDRLHDGILNRDDVSVMENLTFSYPIFTPSDKNSKKVILLLHGLNERSWAKYLTWAFCLSLNTNSYVILFPISFHINRSPVSWKDPRAMIRYLRERKSKYSEVSMSSFANIAISNRLTEDPLRFLNSGYQTVLDIVKLMVSIRDGKHKIIPKGAGVDIFSYSIGAFLAEIIMMSNPEGLFTGSRLFMFCGGSVFSNMHGTSKLIMDSLAYDRVYKYYLDDFEKELRNKYSFKEFLLSGRIGMAFRSMIDLSRFKKFRESALGGIEDQIRSVALLKDTIIPASGIVRTLNNESCNGRMVTETWDFPYPYTHENPFPVSGVIPAALVDDSFDRLFSAASAFFCRR